MQWFPVCLALSHTPVSETMTLVLSDTFFFTLSRSDTSTCLLFPIQTHTHTHAQVHMYTTCFGNQWFNSMTSLNTLFFSIWESKCLKCMLIYIHVCGVEFVLHHQLQSVFDTELVITAYGYFTFWQCDLGLPNLKFTCCFALNCGTKHRFWWSCKMLAWLEIKREEIWDQL